MARTGDLAGAKREVQAMQELRAALAKSNQSYWADRIEEQMLAVSGCVALAEGTRDEALKLMGGRRCRVAATVLGCRGDR
jgi:hypothetical protein